MAKPKNRIVVNDLTKTTFTAPSAGGGASLPSLRTTPNNRAATNSMMESFTGFSKTITQLGLVREKNDSAKEAIDARNAALEGKYKSFDRQESVDIYEQTHGDVKGRSGAIVMQEQLDAGMTDILNQNLTMGESMKAYDELKSTTIKGMFEGELGGTEAYKSGFLPHIISATEKNREQMAIKHKAKFDAYTNTMIAEKVDQVATETNTFNADGTKTGLSMANFNVLVQTGVNAGKTREESTMVVLATLAAKADEEGLPELFNFGKEPGRNGFKIESNPKYNKIIDAGRKAGLSTMIAAGKERDRRETKALADGRRESQAKFYDWQFKNAGHLGAKKMVNQLAVQYSWTPDQITKAMAYSKSLSSGGNIVLDSKLEDQLMRDILIGAIDRESQLADMFTTSFDLEEGIDREALGRLKTKLKEQLSHQGQANAFKRNLDSLKGALGRGKGLIQSSDGKFSTKNQVAAQAVEDYELALSAFVRKHPEEPMHGDVANEWFAEWADKVLNANMPDAIQFDEKKATDKASATEAGEPSKNPLEIQRAVFNERRAFREKKLSDAKEVGAFKTFMEGR